MKFFEVNEPYYALIKAETKESALLGYNSSVADLEGIEEVREVERDYAIAKYSRALSGDGKEVSLKDVLTDIRDGNQLVLIIDGALI
ncbi:hypothetical protein [Oceanobacillus sp. CF4.6]|uniref:hypothetical protein n=1 Tax=Oceanobacillus sp. CF4.6 TaxID=3373080 RepID=UPI003EE6C504